LRLCFDCANTHYSEYSPIKRYMYYGVMQNGVVYSLNKVTTTSFELRLLAPIFQHLDPPLHHYNYVRMHPNAFPQHMKVLKHFINMYYGCVMQNGDVYSLNKKSTQVI
jgi:hypothetical protein